MVYCDFCPRRGSFSRPCLAEVWRLKWHLRRAQASQWPLGQGQIHPIASLPYCGDCFLSPDIMYLVSAPWQEYNLLQFTINPHKSSSLVTHSVRNPKNDWQALHKYLWSPKKDRKKEKLNSSLGEVWRWRLSSNGQVYPSSGASCRSRGWHRRIGITLPSRASPARGNPHPQTNIATESPDQPPSRGDRATCPCTGPEKAALLLLCSWPKIQRKRSKTESAGGL